MSNLQNINGKVPRTGIEPVRDILSYALPTELSRRIESRLTDEQTYPSTSKGAVEEGEAYLERETPRPLTIESLENHRLANPPIYHMTVSGSIPHRIPSSGPSVDWDEDFPPMA